MKPQPRKRTTAHAIPKAQATDPATLNASSSPNAGVKDNASVTPRRPAKTIRKMTLRIAEEDLGRIRAAWVNDLAHGGAAPSLNAWLVDLIMDQVDAIEQHHGERLAPIPAGQIPTGRPRDL